MWGKDSQNYSEMVIKSYVCKHQQHNKRILSPISVALIHKFGTLSLSKESLKFRKQIIKLMNEKSKCLSISTPFKANN